MNLQTIRNFFVSLLAPKYRAQGIDGSHWWGWFKPEQATKSVDFIIIKATQGWNWTDPAFAVNWEGAKQISVRGAYHYQLSGVSWTQQADFFLRTVASYDFQIYAVDIEKAYNEGAFANQDKGDAFFSDMRRIIDYWRGRKPLVRAVLYTNTDIYQNYLYPTIKRLYGAEGVQWLESVDLWLANYNGQGVDGEPTMPTNRATPWKIWQYSSNGRKEDYGTNGDVDLNVFDGTIDELHAWASVDPTTGDGDDGPGEEPETGEPMEKITGTVVVNVLLRMGPSTGYPTVEWAGRNYLPKGALIEATPPAEGGKWLHISKINGVDVTLEAWSNAGGEQQYISWNTVTVPDTEPEPEPEPVRLKHTIKIYSDGSYQVDDGPVIP